MRIRYGSLLTVTMTLLLAVSMVPMPAAAYVALTATNEVVPSSIGPGDSGNLIITIANGGTTYADNVEVTLKTNKYLTFGSTKFNLQTIAAGNSKQTSVPIKISSSMSETFTTIFMDIKYNEGSTTGTKTLEASTSITIQARSLVQVEDVRLNKDPIYPGDNFIVSLDVKNVGKGRLKDTVVTFSNSSLPFVPANGDLEEYIGNLAPGETVSVEFELIANKGTLTTAYQVPVRIDYYDESGTLTSDEKSVGLRVSGRPDFVVTMENDDKLTSGKEGEITISIANRGTATASFLTLSFDSGLEVVPKEYYVGNLEPDDYETVTLKVDATGLPAGQREMTILMDYKDPYNQPLSESALVEFDINNVPTSSMPTTTQLVVVAVLLVIVYWKREAITGIFKRGKK